MEQLDTTALPNVFLSPGQWAFDAAFRVHDGYGHMSGSGNGIGEAVYAAFEDCCDGNLDEAGDPSDWNIRFLMFQGKSILHDTVGGSYEARRELMAFTAWENLQALETLVRKFQRAEVAKVSLDAMVDDLRWMLAVRNGGCASIIRRDGQRMLAVAPRLLYGTTEPCVPPFLLNRE